MSRECMCVDDGAACEGGKSCVLPSYDLASLGHSLRRRRRGSWGQRPGIVCPGIASSAALQPVCREQGERAGVSFSHDKHFYEFAEGAFSFYILVSSRSKRLRCEVQARKVHGNLPAFARAEGRSLITV